MESILRRLETIVTELTGRKAALMDVDLDDEPTEVTPRHLLPDFYAPDSTRG